MEKKALLDKLHEAIQMDGHILAVSPGSAMLAQFSIDGGVDLLSCINAGKFRMMGQTAYAAFLGYSNANKLTMDYAINELLPAVGDFPVFQGVFMQDPNINLLEYLKEIKKIGFSGVINYPTAALLDGKFLKALEQTDLGYDREIEGIRLAHFCDLATLAYVSDISQAIAMAKAGADIISVHFGITGGGKLGANRFLPMELAIKRTNDIFKAIDEVNPDIIKLVCGGPVQTPEDANGFYQNTICQGALLGSAIERIPVEKAVIETVRTFKKQDFSSSDTLVKQVLNGNMEKKDYAEFMIQYIENNYGKRVRLKDLSEITYMSVSRLSVLFKEKTGQSFTQYLIHFRMKKAKEMLRFTDLPIKEISLKVGYEDYSQFVKMFRKIVKVAPNIYRMNSQKIG